MTGGLEGLEGLITEVSSEPVELYTGAQYSSLCLKGGLGHAIQYLISKQWSTVLRSPAKLIAINLAYVDATATEAETHAPSLAHLLVEAQGAGKELKFVSTPDQVKKSLLKLLNNPSDFCDSLPQLLRKQNPKGADFSSDIQLLVSAVIEVFQKQFGIEASARPVQLFDVGSAGPQDSWDVIGMLPMASKGASGTLVLRFQRKTLAELAKLTFGKELAENDPEVAAIAAELVNMVQGCAKAELNQRGYALEQALPQTYVGHSGPMKNNLPKPFWSVDFSTIYGVVGLGVQLQVN